MVEFPFRDQITIPLDKVSLTGDLNIPAKAEAVIIFAHGSGSSRLSSRNKFVASALNNAGFGSLLFDLLTEEEDTKYSNRFEIELLSDRLVQVTHWLRGRADFNLSLGYFGASTGAAATLDASARFGGDIIKAVVSRGGRPDLAMYNLPNVQSPTLLIVGSLDHDVITLNQKAYDELNTEKEMVLVEGASHLFEEPGKLEEVAQHATRWFSKYLKHAYA